MSEFKNKTKEELEKLVMEKRKALQTFRFSVSASKVKNVKEAKGLRKDIARIYTELNSSQA